MSINVLIVDDSATARAVIKSALEKDPAINVVGAAQDAFVARDMIVKLRPDVICLDVEMPKMDGITFLNKIMTHLPTPVIMVSSLTQAGAKTTLDALAYGAFDYVSKTHSNVYDGIAQMENELIDKVKQASRVDPKLLQERMKKAQTHSKPKVYSLSETTQKIVMIGASTGGTVALQDLLSRLPKNFPGIVVVQHMPASFTKGFAQRLDEVCQVDVKEAHDGDRVQTGQVLIAPGSHHLKLARTGGIYRVKYGDEGVVSGHKPSVDVLFTSAAKFAGANAIGIILTGMGKDGAKGLLSMRDAGAKTIAQDEKSSVVYGMPKAAVDLGAADFIEPLDNIGSRAITILKNHKG
ncbi:MAG: chemotaxis response regulator protein-glutamate methylesterase [Arcobacteraceae bacterium]|nr:chemotaxis response regulator protein-glutamate methylesterase [Arcobacteraceae bacterium]